MVLGSAERGCANPWRSPARALPQPDIQHHLQSMFYLLRPEETLKMVLALHTYKLIRCTLNDCDLNVVCHFKPRSMRKRLIEAVSNKIWCCLSLGGETGERSRRSHPVPGSGVS